MARCIDIIEGNNCCVVCGEIIPEGRQVCRKCEMAVELKKTMAEKLKGEISGEVIYDVKTNQQNILHKKIDRTR